MSPDVQSWIAAEGVRFLSSMGVRPGDALLDFGCNRGHYTIPAAKAVGPRGRVYAFDKDEDALRDLRAILDELGLDNVELLHGQTRVPLEDGAVDVALLYDVIHYENDRTPIYREIRRLLKPTGFVSIYPKHNRDDHPLMELASLGIEEIVREVESAGFTLAERVRRRCLHDDDFNPCDILNFQPD